MTYTPAEILKFERRRRVERVCVLAAAVLSSGQLQGLQQFGPWIVSESWEKENGYAYSVSMKSLQAPSVKDFLKIFTFLYGFLCPSYELPDTKFEEEVPRIFRDLGKERSTFGKLNINRPTSERKTSLHNAMKESSPLFDDGQPWGEETEDGIMHNKLFLEYTIKCYESFMTGADSFDEMNAELQSKLTAKNRALNEQIARLEQEREKEPNRLESLRKLKASLQADVQKYQAYMSNLESHSAILDQKLNGLDEEISRV
ncbi:NDC80, partial [Cervus elaphus hippelaphus]